MTSTAKKRRSWENGGRIHITAGHMHKATEQPAVLIIDNLTGNVTPISTSAAYKVANQLVDLAETLERNHT